MKERQEPSRKRPSRDLDEPYRELWQLRKKVEQAEKGRNASAADLRQLVEMSVILRDMLDLIHKGFVTLDLECARKVLQMDKDVDRVCHALFQKHLAENVPPGDTSGFELLRWIRAQQAPSDSDH